MGHLKAFFFTLKQDQGSALVWNICIYIYYYFFFFFPGNKQDPWTSQDLIFLLSKLEYRLNGTTIDVPM